MKTDTAAKLYLVRAGRNGEDENYCLENNAALIGFTEYPSLAGCKTYDDVFKLVKKTRPDLQTRAAGNYAGQLWAFAVAMQPGDLVVLPCKLTSQIAIGRVDGPYAFAKVDVKSRHTRPVEWLRTDIPRTAFEQDLLFSFGAFMTVCAITRHNAALRVQAVLGGKPDPGYVIGTPKPAKGTAASPQPDEDTAPLDLEQAAHDQIVAHIQSRFSGHNLARLVAAVLNAEGWVTQLSPPGPDGGVDILAGRGSLGLESPHLCVQVKSQASPVDVTVYRALMGTMQSFKAGQGLLVAWGGFNKAVQTESKQGYFAVRLWESRDLVEALYRNYDRLPAEIQADLPLKRVWVLVNEEPES
jgi:restriction system protein